MQYKAVCFEKGNIDDLRDKLQELLVNDNEVESYKEQAQEYICGKYDWDEVVERTIKIYEVYNK